MLGLTSFVFGLVSLVLWAALFIVAGIAHNRGMATPSSNVIVGLIFILGCLLNFTAMVLGAIGAFKCKANTLSIIGGCMNGFLLLAVFGLVILGLMVKGVH